MRRADLEPGEKIQNSVLNQVGEGEGRLQGMADDVVEIAISLQPAFVYGCSGDLGMDEDQRFEFLGLGPDGIKFGRGEILAIHAAANGKATHALFLDALFDLLDGKGCMLQGDAAKADETIGVGGAKRGNFLVLNLDDLAREALICPIPPRIDGNGLHINSHLVEVRQALIDVEDVAQAIGVSLLRVAMVALARDPIFDEVPSFGHTNVRVHVNDRHALAVDGDWSALRAGRRLCG